MGDPATWVLNWLLPDGSYIDLVTEPQFDHLPPGTVFTSMEGVKATKGLDVIDRHTIGGFMAWGRPCPRHQQTGRIHAD